VCSSDLKISSSENVSLVKWDSNNSPRIPAARILEVGILNDHKQVGSDVISELPIQVYIKFFVEKNSAKVGTSVLLYNQDNVLIFASMSNHEKNWHMKERPEGNYKSICEIPPNLLADGDYSLSIVLWGGFYENGITEENILRFAVHERGYVRGDYPNIQRGHIIQPLLNWISIQED